MKTTDKVLQVMDTRPHGTWWFTTEIRDSVNEMFPVTRPMGLGRIDGALGSLLGQELVELRIKENEEGEGRAQFSLSVGRVAARSSIVIPDSRIA